MNTEKHSLKEHFGLLVLSAVIALLSMVVFDPTGTCRYLFGYYVGNFVLFTLSFGMVSLIVIAAYFAVLFTFAVALFRKRFKLNKSAVYIIVGALILPPTMFIVHGINPPASRFLQGFYAKTQKHMDVSEVRTWLTSLDDETFAKWCDSYLKHSDPINVPKTIFEVQPASPAVLIFADAYGGRHIELEWGGPFGRWGIIIGPKELEIPSSYLDSDSKQHFKVDEGIGAWQQLP